LWINDADAVLVTPDYTVDEARAHLTLVALTGGSLFLGDRLDTLPDDRLALLKHAEILNLWREGSHAIPLDLFKGEPVPSVWKVKLENAAVFGIFNWTDDAAKRSWMPDDLWIDPSCDYAVRDMWTGDQWTISEGKLVLDQAPHSVRLLKLEVIHK